jgi:hypothetical protein
MGVMVYFLPAEKTIIRHDDKLLVLERINNQAQIMNYIGCRGKLIKHDQRTI